MPNQSKEQPQQPRGSKVASTQTQNSPWDMGDQLTGAQDSPWDVVDQVTGAQDSLPNMVDQYTQTTSTVVPALNRDGQFHGRVIELLRALNTVMAKKVMRVTGNPPREQLDERDRLDPSHLGLITSDQYDISLQLGSLIARMRVPTKEDPTGDLTAEPEQQPEPKPCGEPLAKRKKEEGSQAVSSSTSAGEDDEPNPEA
ncbi:uncharacterized protein LOC6526074 [Drosophila yakuba]|uniref:Uncharacterized protein, isoform B n=1 Tax=Drosophila yakuba TaxID=7245 RepID=A0A0R1EIU8_DROYA|nr:uncharacterized protein LOC6526074 [Drosophila yakuba]KRK07074.1 uncharacterized protein Dyak_GE17873, isoform B [Drosophila yakuba]